MQAGKRRPKKLNFYSSIPKMKVYGMVKTMKFLKVEIHRKWMQEKNYGNLYIEKHWKKL